MEGRVGEEGGKGEDRERKGIGLREGRERRDGWERIRRGQSEDIG